MSSGVSSSRLFEEEAREEAEAMLQYSRATSV